MKRTAEKILKNIKKKLYNFYYIKYGLVKFLRRFIRKLQYSMNSMSMNSTVQCHESQLKNNFSE